LIAWTHWPAQQKPWRSLLSAVLIAAAIGVFWSIELVYGVVATFALLSSTAEFLLPTRFRLTAEGVETLNAFRRVRRTWDRFESFGPNQSGYHLRGNGPRPSIARRRNLRLPCLDEKTKVKFFLAQRLKEVL